MSIDQKIAQLLEEAQKLKENVAQEVVQEETVSEDVSVEEAQVETEEIQQDTDTLTVTEADEGTEINIDVSEDVAALVNGEELTEEFKAKAATIFEAAVLTRVKAEIAKLEESFEQRLQDDIETITEGLVEKVDGYLNYVVEQWMKDNEIALENGIKNEIFESFIENMKHVFEQHYVDMPEEKFDILSNMEEQLEEMKGKLDEQLGNNVELNKQLNEMKRDSAIKEYSSGLTDTDSEKFKNLASELVFEDTESFEQKLKTIKENYFSKKTQSAIVESVVTDEPVAIAEEVIKKESIDPTMSQYVRAIKAHIK